MGDLALAFLFGSPFVTVFVAWAFWGRHNRRNGGRRA